MLQADGLTRRYGDFVAVNDVSFAIEPGEVVGLLGHNGAGKTTIMKMLTAYLEPSTGEVRIDGEALADDPKAAQTRIGYLPENLPLYPELTVADYLAYVAEVRGLEPANAVPEAVRSTELQDKLTDPIATLSRGFKQRVGVAQAILHKPDFLILDEPTNGLDPSQTQQMRQLIRSLSASATVILSTHIMQEVNAVCDRALILRSGQLVVDERLSDLVNVAALRVRAGGGDAGAVLADVAGVQGVADEGDSLRVDIEGDVDACASSVVAALVAGGLSVQQVTPIQQDLEAVFRSVNEEVA